MNPVRTWLATSPAKLFAFGSLGLFAVSVIAHLAGFAGTPAVDLARYDYGNSSVAAFAALTPVVFLVIVGLHFLYAKTARRPLNPAFVWSQLFVSASCACAAIYLSSNRIDVPVSDWQEQMGWWLVFQMRLFLASRLIFVGAQVLFVAGLLLNLLVASPRRSA